MSFSTMYNAFNTAGSTVGAIASVAEHHSLIIGSRAEAASACAPAPINDTVKEPFEKATRELLKEIKPAEVGSPVSETATPSLNP